MPSRKTPSARRSSIPRARFRNGERLTGEHTVTLSIMLLGFDVLHRLRVSGGQTVSSLASVLPASEEETKRVLDVLVAAEMVSAAPAGFEDPSTQLSVYVSTPKGEDTYERILDRWAVELHGPSTMNVAERFLVTLDDGASPGVHEQLMRALDELPQREDDFRLRTEALALAGAAVGWAQRAVEADPVARGGAGLSLPNMPRADAEDFASLAIVMRDDYRDEFQEDARREVLDAAARTAEAAGELAEFPPPPAPKAAGERRPPVAARDIDREAYMKVAEEAAQTLRALGKAGSADVVSEARTIAQALAA